MFRRLAVCLPVLAACGRLGFEPHELDDGGAGDAVVDAGPGILSVKLFGAIPIPGTPIEGATVMFVEHAGPTTVAHTDANGEASQLVGGATTVHVSAIAGTEVTGWTIADVGGGTSITVGVPPTPPMATMTVTLPVHATATLYQVSGGFDCGDVASSSATSLTLGFETACEGQSRHMIARAEAGGALGWIDLGIVTYAAGAVLAPPGPWQAVVGNTIELTGLPSVADTTELLLQLATGLQIATGWGTVSGGASSTVIDGANLAPEIVSATYSGMPVASILARGAPAMVNGAYPLTLADFNREFTSFDIDEAAGTATWSLGSVGHIPSLIYAELSFSADGYTVEWNYLAPGTATSAAVPVDPELVPFTFANATWDMQAVLGLSLWEQDYASMVENVFLTQRFAFDPASRIAQSMRFWSPAAVARSGARSRWSVPGLVRK